MLKEEDLKMMPSRHPNRPLVPLRELQFGSPGATLTLSLWGPLAELAPAGSLLGKVLSVSRARVRMFGGVRNLSLSPPGFYDESPEEPGVRALEVWAEGRAQVALC